MWGEGRGEEGDHITCHESCFSRPQMFSNDTFNRNDTCVFICLMHHYALMWACARGGTCTTARSSGTTQYSCLGHSPEARKHPLVRDTGPSMVTTHGPPLQHMVPLLYSPNEYFNNFNLFEPAMKRKAL